jgi:ANTAR domain
VNGDSGDSPADVVRRLEAARLEFDTQTQRFEAAKSRLQETVDTISVSRPRRELLYQSRAVRLQARLETMPIVEQAKGILMAQQRCGPDEAFDLLRRASQRGNIKVHVLAAQLVARLTAPAANGDVKPYPVTDSMHM